MDTQRHRQRLGVRYKTKNKNKTNKTKQNKIKKPQKAQKQKTKTHTKKIWTIGTPPPPNCFKDKIGGDPKYSRRVSSSCFLLATRCGNYYVCQHIDNLTFSSNLFIVDLFIVLVLQFDIELEVSVQSDMGYYDRLRLSVEIIWPVVNLIMISHVSLGPLYWYVTSWEIWRYVITCHSRVTPCCSTVKITIRRLWKCCNLELKNKTEKDHNHWIFMT